MSTALLTAPAGVRDARPGLGRLTAVELRKMTDTRAGFWLLLSTAALTVAVVVLFAVFAEERDHTLRELLAVAVAPASVLLPVVGILLVSSEWSQRTAVLTFALVPERSRVIAAKLAAGGVLARDRHGQRHRLRRDAARVAPAIVLYFGLPLAWTALGSLPFLEGAARWLDGARSLSPLTEEMMSTTQWARAGTTLAVWMVLPLLIGLWRVTRGDVR